MRSKYCLQSSFVLTVCTLAPPLKTLKTFTHYLLCRYKKKVGEPSGSSVFCYGSKGSNDFIQKFYDRLGVYVSHHNLSMHPFFSPPKFEFFVSDRCLSFVQKTPLLTLTTQHQFFTKTNILYFISLQGTYSLFRVPLLLYNSGFTALYQKRLTRVWELRFFPSMGSSFYSRTEFVINFSSFCA